MVNLRKQLQVFLNLKSLESDKLIKDFIFSKAARLDPATLLKTDFFYRYSAMNLLTFKETLFYGTPFIGFL